MNAATELTLKTLARRKASAHHLLGAIWIDCNGDQATGDEHIASLSTTAGEQDEASIVEFLGYVLSRRPGNGNEVALFTRLPLGSARTHVRDWALEEVREAVRAAAKPAIAELGAQGGALHQHLTRKIAGEYKSFVISKVSDGDLVGMYQGRIESLVQLAADAGIIAPAEANSAFRLSWTAVKYEGDDVGSVLNALGYRLIELGLMDHPKDH